MREPALIRSLHSLQHRMAATYFSPVGRVLALVLLVSLTGCGQAGYYLQAAKGQYLIIANRQPVEAILSSPETPEPLRKQLALAKQMRQFAVDRLQLDNNRSYTHYTDTGRPYVVWNVVATPAYDLSPKTWCFPIAGCVSYKGYFEEAKARSAGDALRAKGLDVTIYGVRAYSTLGWFDDPLLNTFIHASEPGLAAVIFHELAHQWLYVEHDSAFSEAFATAVEIALVTEWLERYGDPETVPIQLERRRRQAEITKMILQYRTRLVEAYRRPDRESLKPALFAQMKQQYKKWAARGQGTLFYDWWFQRPLNNADLASVATYHHLVPAFQKLLQQAGGDYSAFRAEVGRLATLPTSERKAVLERLLSD